MTFQPTTRRQFLKRIGQGLAVSAWLPTWAYGRLSRRKRLPFPGRIVGERWSPCHALREGKILSEPPVPEPYVYDVIILGAGISGLAAAWKLARCGVTDLLVLERADRIGGTSRAEEGGEIVFPWGAHYIESPQPGQKHLLEIGEDLGIILGYYANGWPMVNPNYIVPQPEVSLLAGKRWRPTHFPLQIASSQDVIAFERFRQILYRWVTWRDADGRRAFGCPNQDTSPAEEVRALDRISMQDYLDSLGIRSEPVRWYVDNRMQDEYGCRLHNVSAWAGIHFWAQSNSSFMDFEPPGTPAPALLSWPEGNLFLARGLARHLKPGQIRLNALVTRVQDRGDRVWVSYLDGETHQRRTLQARWVVYAIPKHLVDYLIPELRQAGRTEFKACEYVPWLTAAVHLRHLPRGGDRLPAWEVLAYGAWGLGYIDNRHMHHQPYRWDLPTVLTFYAALADDVDRERYELLQGDWEYWARRVLHVLEQMHPGIADLITRLDIFKWGHAMVAMRPGFLWGAERQAMQRPFGRIHFAGGDIGGTPVFEQASYRGIEVAEAILDAMGRSYRSSIR